jgi:hypothetical protein
MFLDVLLLKTNLAPLSSRGTPPKETAGLGLYSPGAGVGLIPHRVRTIFAIAATGDLPLIGRRNADETDSPKS